MTFKIVPAEPGWAVLASEMEDCGSGWVRDNWATQVICWVISYEGDSNDTALEYSLFSGMPMIWDWNAWPEPRAIAIKIGQCKYPVRCVDYRLARATPESHPEWKWIVGIPKDPDLHMENVESDFRDFKWI